MIEYEPSMGIHLPMAACVLMSYTAGPLVLFSGRCRFPCGTLFTQRQSIHFTSRVLPSPSLSSPTTTSLVSRSGSQQSLHFSKACYENVDMYSE